MTCLKISENFGFLFASLNLRVCYLLNFEWILSVVADVAISSVNALFSEF